MSALTQQQIDHAAQALFGANVNGEQIGILSLQYPQMNMDDAYAIQQSLVSQLVADGRHTVGWKIGLTSKAMQSALNIDIPDSGILLNDMIFETGATVPQGRFIQPRIEAEIAFVMGADLSGADVTRDDVNPSHRLRRPRTGDSRYTHRTPRSPRPALPARSSTPSRTMRRMLASSWDSNNTLPKRWIYAGWEQSFARNDEVEETGLGAGVLNDPVEGYSLVSTAPRAI